MPEINVQGLIVQALIIATAIYLIFPALVG